MGLARDAARVFVRQWRIAGAAGWAEARATPMLEKARQLAALMASAHVFDRRALDREDTAVRRRWAELRRRAHGAR